MEIYFRNDNNKFRNFIIKITIGEDSKQKNTITHDELKYPYNLVKLIKFDHNIYGFSGSENSNNIQSRKLMVRIWKAKVEQRKLNNNKMVWLFGH